MADGRKNNGGHKNSGRKSKAEELKLIEKLGPMEDLALEKLREGLEKGDYKFVQLYFAYMYGKPKESKDITSAGDKIGTIINLGNGE